MSVAPPPRRRAMALAYVAFASGYLLSYTFRTVNAVISPELTRQLGIDPASLGLLTSAYFLAFGAFQIPAGILLDRFGPRRVEPVLLAAAALGAFVFASSDSVGTLLVGRAIIGLGVCVCLMAPLKALAVWYPAERQASLSGWIMVAGGLGALASTTPLEVAMRFGSWRAIFVALGLLTLAVALLVAALVPDVPPPAGRIGLRVQLAGVAKVLRDARFWWIAPLATVGMGSFMAIQGLWAVPWMIEVEGTTRAVAAARLLGMSFTIIGGYLFLGLFATRLAHLGIRAAHLFGSGFVGKCVALAAIVSHASGGWWWVVYGLGSSVNVLAFSVLNQGFPRALAARVNTALNLLMFGGSFLVQWGIGIAVDVARDRYGLATRDGLQAAFTIVVVLDAAACAWFATRWRHHANMLPSAMATP